MCLSILSSSIPLQSTSKRSKSVNSTHKILRREPDTVLFVISVTQMLLLSASPDLAWTMGNNIFRTQSFHSINTSFPLKKKKLKINDQVSSYPFCFIFKGTQPGFVPRSGGFLPSTEMIQATNTSSYPSRAPPTSQNKDTTPAGAQSRTSPFFNLRQNDSTQSWCGTTNNHPIEIYCKWFKQG